MKKFIIGMFVGLMALSCVGCGNKSMFDTTYTFNRAIIELPNGKVIEGKVETWTDFEDGDQIQVKIDGTTYLVHAADVVLIAD